MTTNLCLGTVQFGQNYGVTNTKGQVKHDEVAEILSEASKAGIRYLDTAQSYGNAEEVIGQCRAAEKGFRIVSKLAAQEVTAYGDRDTHLWEDSVQRSLKKIRASSMDTLLLHRAQDLARGNSARLVDWLASTKERGLTNKIGVSIYKEEDLDGIDLSMLDAVQLPLSLLDQTHIDNGLIQKLGDMDIEVHVRSVFLQGLLVTPPNKWPRWIDGVDRMQHEALERLADSKGSSLKDLAIGFVKEQADIQMVVIGVCSISELKEMVLAWSKQSPWEDGEWRDWSAKGATLLDPRDWPRP